MKRNMFLSALSIFYLLTFHIAEAQNDVEERIYVHLSSQDLIIGETLFYSAYCLGNDSQKPSQLSKILYVEIIGENGVIHQNKISLIKGRGQGELFITSLISTGQYQIIAYTRWMRNFEKYYKAPLTIINPFEIYKPENDSTSKKVSVAFHPTTGTTVSEVLNRMNYKIIGSNPINSDSYKLKILDGDNKLVTESSPDRFGLGQFEWTPKTNSSYRAILEDSLGQFNFFNLPEVTNSGTVLTIKKKQSFYEIGVHTSPDKNKIGKLVIRTKTKEIISKPIPLNSVHLEPQSKLNGDLIFVEVFNIEDQLLSRTFIVNSQLDVSTPETNLKSVYGTRQKVDIKSELDKGSYSISVRKKSETRKAIHTYSVASKWENSDYKFVVNPSDYLSDPKRHSINLVLVEDKSLTSNIKNLPYLPEYRDEFVDGQLVDDSKRPISEALVSLSMTSEHEQIRISKTKKDGSFSLPFESTLKETTGYLSYLDLDSNYYLSVKSPFIAADLDFEKSPLILDSLQIHEIISRSIRNQIENAFYNLDDKVILENKFLPIIPYTEEYILDDYTRFRTLSETFTEYIISANVRENRDQIFKVLQQTEQNSIAYPPLLLLNGIPVEDNKILSFSAYKIAKIAILNHRFYLGSLIADGVIGFTTKEDNLGGFKLDSKYLQTKIKELSVSKSYKFPTYESDKSTSRPDQRDLLYWNPNISLKNSTSLKFDFYTSDVSGTFELIIEGFTDSGKAVSIIENFEVQKELLAIPQTSLD